MSDRTYSVLRIFLASPSDLQEEREISRKVVDRINRSVGDNLGVRLDIWGWEDLPPDRGRPQELINEKLRESDIFLGLLWNRWGTPPSEDGEYQSGFEEEFNIARDLHEKGQIGKVAVYFKEIVGVNPNSIEQVTKVVEFRDSIDQELLFGTFRSPAEWKETIRDHLASHVTEYHASLAPKEASQAPKRLPGQEAETELVRVDDSLEAVQQNFRDSKHPLSPLESARAHLYTQTLALRSVYQATTLGVEQLTTLYRVRQQIELTEPEHSLVYLTLMADREKVKPGWYWLDVDVERLKDTLESTATQGPFELAQRHARELLQSVDETAYCKVILEAIARDNVHEAELALGPIIEHPEPGYREFLHTLFDEGGGDVAKTVWRGILKLKAKDDAKDAIEWIVNTPKEKRGRYSDLIEDILDEADTEHRRMLVTVETGRNRAKVLNALRGDLAEGELREFAQDDNLDVVAVALMEMIERGKDVADTMIDERLLPRDIQPTSGIPNLLGLPSGSFGRWPSIYSRREVLRTLYRTWSEDELEEGIKWSSNGALRYEVLMEGNFESQGERLRGDIRNAFEDIPDRALLGILAGDEDGGDDSFTVGCFYRAAFRVLANHAEPEDAAIATDFLLEPHDSTFKRNVIEDAFRILEQHGEPDDVDVVWKYVDSEEVGIPKQAAALILNLDPDQFQEHAIELLNTEESAIQRVVFRFTIEKERNLPEKEVRRFLYDADSTTRRAALAYFVQHMSDDELEEMLDAYPQAEDIDFDFYYYDVIGWLDRLLYAPGPIREYYQSELENGLQ